MSKLRMFVFISVPLLLLLLFAEVGLRASGIYLRRPVYYALPAGVEAMPPGAGEDPDLFWVRYPYLMNWMLDEIAGETATNRVVTLGGSIAAGWTGGSIASGLPVSYNETFSGLAVQEAINAGYDARGIVLAQGAYSSHHSRVLMDRIAERGGRPTLVVVCNAVNDAWARSMSARQQARLNHRVDRWLAHQLNRSRVFAALRYLIVAPNRSRYGFDAGPEKTRPFVSLAEYEENLNAIADRTEAGGGQVALVSQPMPDAFNRRRLEGYFDVCARIAAARESVYFVDVRPPIDELRRVLGVPQRERTRPGDLPDAIFADEYGHQTPLAMSAVADVLFETMQSEKLLRGGTGDTNERGDAQRDSP